MPKMFQLDDIVTMRSQHGSHRPWANPPDRRGWVSNGEFFVRCADQPPGKHAFVSQERWDGLLGLFQSAQREKLFPKKWRESAGVFLAPYEPLSGDRETTIDLRLSRLLDGLEVVRLVNPALVEAGLPQIVENFPIGGVADDGELSAVVLAMGFRS